MASKNVELDLSPSYDADQDRGLSAQEHAGLLRRLSLWRGQKLARKALQLAGEPNLVLDFPTLKGRYWPLLAHLPTRVVLAADSGEPDISQLIARYPRSITERIQPLAATMTSIPLDTNAVDSIFCMRFMQQQLIDPAQRTQILNEFHRVTRDTLIISLWVDGNYKSWKRKRLEARRAALGQSRVRSGRSVVARGVIESEFKSVGFNILGSFDFLPGYAMWRVYILRKSH